MSLKKIFLFILLCFIIVASVLFFQKESLQSPHNADDKISKVTSSTLYNFDTNIQTHYELSFKQNSALLTSDSLPGKLSYGFEVNAILNMRVLQKDKKFYWLAYELSEFDLKGDGVTQIMLDKLTPYYTSMFLVKVDKFAHVLDMQFGAKDINVAGLSQLISILEVINLNKKAYQEEHKDSVGTYEAFYRKNNTKIKKQKTKYINVHSPDSRYGVKVKKFALLAEIDKHSNWLKNLTLDESLFIRDENNKPYAKNKNIVKLLKSNKNINNSLKIWKEDRDVQSILKEFRNLKKTDKNVFEIIIDETNKERFIKSQVTINSLVDKLKADPKNYNNYREIAKFIKLFPDTTSELKAFIINAGDGESLRLLSILSLVGTSQAQDLLSDIALSDNVSHMNNIRAIIGLGGVSEITQNSINTLIQISDIRSSIDNKDKSNTSLLALGSHANSSENQNEEIVSYIQAQYSSDKSLDREKNILFSMQNAGAENFISEIEVSLKSQSPKVRLVAIQTIGTMKDTNLRENLLKEQQIIQEDKKVKELISKLLSK